jgi:hypothetical protein
MSVLSSATERLEAPVGARVGRNAREPFVRSGLAVAAGTSWLALAFITLRWPDVGDRGRGPELAIGAGVMGVGLMSAGAFGGLWSAGAARLRRMTPWLLALGVFFSVWQATTAKLGVLPQPFFPPPHAILEVFTDDWAKLAQSVFASIKLELLGFAVGVDRLRHGRRARLVSRVRLLGASDHAPDRAVAGDRLAADRLLRLSVELERVDLPDRVDDGISGRRAYVVGRGGRQRGLLRRRAHARREPVVPGV